MKAKIIIDGKECEIALTEDQQTEIEKISKKPVKRWEDLGSLTGFYIDEKSKIKCIGAMTVHNINRHCFAIENQAKSVLAMAQLSQLVKDVNGNWKPDWKDLKQEKLTIDFIEGNIIKTYHFSNAQFLAFPTAEIRDQFLEDHKELIETYFLIYQ